MTDLQENLGWIIGSIATAIAMAIGWFLSSGVVVNLLFLLIGAGITYFVQTRTQRRAWKRDNDLTMRDKVYGPLYRDLSKILKSLELVEHPEWEIVEELKKEMDYHLFYKIGQDLKNKLYALLDIFDKYQRIYYATESKILDFTKNEVEQTFQIDIGKRSGAVTLHLKIGDVGLDFVTLEETVFRKISPKDFVNASKKKWEDVSIEVNIGGKRNLNDIQSLYESVLSEVEKEPLYREEKKQREVLVAKLEEILKQIEVFLDID